MKLLIVLVGSNPLPIYVTVKYFTQGDTDLDQDLAAPDKICFISTDRTMKYAESICSVMKLTEDKTIFINLEDDGRKPLIIRKKIKQELEKLFHKTDMKGGHVIHLNYIGGTKAMAVQAELAVSEWINSRPNVEYILSDVDPDLNKIILSETGKRLPVGCDLKDNIKLTTRELLHLHGMKIHRQGHESISVIETDLINFCLQLLKNYQSPDYKKFTKELRSLRGKYDKAKQYVTDVQKIEVLISQHGGIQNSLKYFQNQLPIITSLFTASDAPNVKLITFITGGWLEELVQRSLTHLQNEEYLRIHEVRRNVKAEYDKRTTEIDVIAIQGYQLFLFSCTTTNQISIVKQKAFEALYRAEQLGGEHARVIVVSTLYNNYNSDDPTNKDLPQNVHNLQELKKDLMQFDAERNCSLIGLKELEGEIKGENDLTNKVKYILEGGS